jgi:hypothetical protein
METSEVYRYYEAPKRYQISTNGGDEDYVVIGDYRLAEEIAERLAICGSDEYEVDGEKFFITCHA